MACTRESNSVGKLKWCDVISRIEMTQHLVDTTLLKKVFFRFDISNSDKGASILNRAILFCDIAAIRLRYFRREIAAISQVNRAILKSRD